MATLFASSPPTATVIKRVTMPLAGAVGSADLTQTPLDLHNRQVVVLPLQTKRWRVRWRNYRIAAAAARDGSLNITGVWIGSPATGGTASTGVGTDRWNGSYASAPTQAIAADTTPSDASDWTSPWVTSPALQFAPDVARVVSMGIIKPGGVSGVVAYGNPFALGWHGSGASADAGNAVASGGAGGPSVWGDWRLEYEFETTVNNGIPVAVFIGDSITAGRCSDVSDLALLHETLPGAAGLRKRMAAINLGISSTQATNWATSSDWIYQRIDWTTTVPDIAYVMLGTNDIFFGTTTAATIQARIQAVIANLVTLGVPKIVLLTMIPREYTGASETARTTVNAWMGTMPQSVSACIDADVALRNPGTPASGLSEYMTSGDAHPLLRGYQALANIVR